MDELVNKRVCALAKEHDLTVPQTLEALDRHPIELDRDRYLRHTLAMELIELDRLQQAFRDKALEDRDVASGLLLLKVAERRATLLGMNAPQGHAVHVIQHPPANKPTSTDRIEAAMNALLVDQRGQPQPAVEQRSNGGDDQDKLN